MEDRPASLKQHSNRKLRVLLLAELCNPRWASVPLEAYSLAKAYQNVMMSTLPLLARFAAVKHSNPIPLLQRLIFA